MKLIFPLACAAALALAPFADAAVITPTKENGDFIAGSGIPGDGFTIGTPADVDRTESVGLKARSRDTGQPLFQSGDVYYVKPGLAANGVDPWWSFDFQFSPGENGLPAEDYILLLSIDFNPNPIVPDIVTVPIPTTATDPSGDGYIENPGAGAWSSDTVPYVVANSSHLGFDFWQQDPIFAPPFNPNAVGVYEISLGVSTGLFDPPIATVTIFVNVLPVPEPGSMAMILGAAVCGLPVLRRRLRK